METNTIIVIGVAILAIVALIFSLIFKRRLPYKFRPLLTKNEYPFWKVLQKKAEKNGIIVCPKVRMEDFLTVDTKNNKVRASYRGRIKSRHIDFILCDKKLNMVAGLELDDNSHKYNASQISGDAFKNEVFKTIGKPLYRVIVSDDYDEQVEAIIHDLKSKRLI